MARNDSFFYISGIISLSLFSFILFLVIYSLFSPKKIDSFALKKDNFISVSIVMPKVESQKAKKEVSAPTEEAPVIPEPKKVDIDDLFSEVITKDIKKDKPKEKPKDNKRVENTQKKLKVAKENNASKIAKKLDKSVSKSADEEKSAASTSPEVNEYLAKIQGLVYEHFNPPPNSQGNSVKAVIQLSPIGKVLDFRILTYSGNSELNKECDQIKDRLMSVIFPINPENKTQNNIVILRSEE
jgi:protein TonB